MKIYFAFLCSSRLTSIEYLWEKAIGSGNLCGGRIVCLAIFTAVLREIWFPGLM